jgi:acyl-CoA thioester hydrolase
MQEYKTNIQIRWADIDANRHLRHSAYYDYGATARISFLTEGGLSTAKLEELQTGPVLFREEALFKREIKFEDTISVDMLVIKATRDFGRWSIRHQFVKGDGTLAAIVTVEGAWIDLIKRKLAVPGEFVHDVFNQFPKAPDFTWTEK